ncbi:MAG: Inner membrane protein CreD [Verrucomicrobia bacterium ADurb.Bin345]|nr:MAG: Inner membrane protein CreD [Verrucomicrobia bacterium ADurb.Bin345]
MLSIPYSHELPGPGGKKVTATAYLHVLPDSLNITGTVAPEIRYRGIYETVLYNARVSLAAQFTLPDLRALGIHEKRVQWDRVSLELGISDMKGVRKEIVARAGDSAWPMEPGLTTSEVLDSGVSARVPVTRNTRTLQVTTELDLNGSEQLSFVPVGKETSAELSSTWRSPSFDGAFLPVRRKVSDAGFSARWDILHLNRAYPQHWIGDRYKIADSAFGVGLLIPTDAYQKSERTVKYAALFIALTFLSFFLSEVLLRVRLHPLQYLLIGLALVIFYTLLLSISEHLSFGRGYLIAGAATIALVTGYAGSILRKARAAWLVGSILAVLYGYLYVLLQLEDYALLLGSIGLFVILGTVMFLTRRINWYNPVRAADSTGSQG